ncbi:MAG TPA: RNA-binding cell elongation regulator Jag/EloR [Candidatus Limnocylindria bacterium]|nr:RNA-binding cell elongation regulator Jag/EloR [Candidatus Limnocylindria bacterium]
MSPLRGEEFTGRTVEEAIERGLHQLGRRRDQVDIEILEKGKPANMLGIGGEDARVLLTFDEQEREPEPALDDDEVPSRPDARREDQRTFEEPAPALGEELETGATVLRELLDKMGIQAEVEVGEEPGHEGLEVLGPELGAVIGRGGENLVALQQIVSAVTSRRVGRTVHVPVDVEGYRRRREEQLREIARRVAARVRTSGQAMTLEPMLAYERRIVHLAVQGEAGIRTESVGVEPNRRVVISSTAPGARGPAAPLRRPPPGPGMRRPSGAPSYGPRRGFGPRPGGYRPRPPGGGSWDRSR